MLSPHDGLAVDLGRRCDDCGRIVGRDEPLVRTPYGTDACDECTQLLALQILGGVNRRERRRVEARSKKKGDRNRKKRRR